MEIFTDENLLLQMEFYLQTLARISYITASHARGNLQKRAARPCPQRSTLGNAMTGRRADPSWTRRVRSHSHDAAEDELERPRVAGHAVNSSTVPNAG